jgi:hypothetical protein
MLANSEAIHTGFRKGVDGGGSAEIWRMIQRMPREKWADYVWRVRWSSHEGRRNKAGGSAAAEDWRPKGAGA